MKLIDTHCHIHDKKYGFDADAVLQNAAAAGLQTMICVGNDLEDSQDAVDFVQNRSVCVASIGIHPHGADKYLRGAEVYEKMDSLTTQSKVVAMGECGLDYYYSHSSHENQQELLKLHIEIAKKHDKPLVFHVRDAFEDFWKIFDEYQDLRGVVHSFTATRKELQEALNRGLYIGLNGIMTFSKDPERIEVIKSVPADRLLLETDAPFLTPVPKRGTMNEPANVSLVCEYLAHIRRVSSESLAIQTTQNAQRLFVL